MKKEIKRNIITKNANQTSKTAFKKIQNLNLTAMVKNKKEEIAKILAIKI